ncbi:MAG TPA: hypothetical protein DIU37_00205 [Opitutae bacterium]|nr:hypothetical protein [Opitutae bacterium]|tara:strand:- start:11156 stop:12559 length:1404 start_codon:yes stop_codon:yes gene_type:complete
MQSKEVNVSMLRRFLVGSFFLLAGLACGFASGEEASVKESQVVAKWMAEWPVPEAVFPQLKDIITQLPKHAPSMLIQDEEAAYARGKRLSDRSHRLPRAQGFAGVQRQAKARNSLDQFIYKTVPVGRFDVVQPVFHWGALKARSDMGDLRVEAAHLEYEEVLRALVLEVRRVYFDLLIQNARVRLLEQNSEIAEKNYIRAQNRYQLAEITRGELNEANIAYQDVKTQVALTMQALQQNEAYFRNITGWVGPLELKLPLDWAIPERVQSLIDNHFFEENSIHPGARYFALEKERKLEQLNYKVINARLLPIFNARTGVYENLLESPDTSKTENETNFFVGVDVEWRVFDGFETKGEKIASKARARRLKREAQLELELRGIEAKQLAEKTALDAEIVDIRENQLKLAEDKLRRVQQDLGGLQATATDYLEAKMDRDNVQLNLLTAKMNLLYDASALLSFFGKDPAFLLF